MTDLQSLIIRLEKATGPDRELDAEIWAAVRPDLRSAVAFAQWKGLRPRGEDWDTAFANYCRERAPHFSRSVDAALTLVPEGWQWVVGGDRAANGGPWADVQPNHTGVTKTHAPTPSLALCTAALKARMETERG